ncbi:MAG: glycosyltransferase family 4 protein [bacterium]|nr:glycosyltransferase family 4 protein [bacterium]
MRIARILTRLNLGGPARQVLESDPRLQERGHEMRVFCGSPEEGEGDLSPLLEAQGISVQRVAGLTRAIHPWQDLQVTRFLRSELQAWGPDIVHTHASKAGWVGRIAARGLRARMLHTFHGHVFDGHFSPPKTALLVFIERLLARRTDQIVAVSHGTRRELVALGVAPESRIHMLYGGADVTGLAGATSVQAKLRGALGLGQDALLIGVLGRLAPIKCTPCALRAFEIARRELPGAFLVFIGDGPDRLRLEQDLEKCAPELKACVFLVGPWGNMAHMLPDLDILLSASHHEGLPISMVEAGACCVPSVATPVGGVREFVIPGQTGFIGDSVETLAEGLVALGSDGDLRRALGKGAQALALEQHGGEAFADRLEMLYMELLERTP